MMPGVLIMRSLKFMENHFDADIESQQAEIRSVL